MEIAVGLKYNVEFVDCCVRGSFTSVLTEAKGYDDDGELCGTSILEYGVELKFENGVNLTAWNAVDLELVE